MGSPINHLAVNAVSTAPGGGLVILLGYLAAWERAGVPWKTTVFASRDGVIAALQEQVAGLEVVPFAAGKHPAVHFALQQTRLGPLIDSTGANVVLSSNALAGRCDAPQVALHQNLWRFERAVPDERPAAVRLMDAVRDRASRHAVRRAQANVYISDYLRVAAERVVPGSAGRNHVIFNGVDPALFDPPEGGTPERDRYRLAAVQTPEQYKNTGLLIDAFAEIRRRRPDQPWRLTIAGGNDPTAWNPYRAQADRLGVAVDWAGYLSRDQMKHLMYRAGCLVHPSSFESFGLSVIEAMGAGCPVIAVDATALPEITGDAAVLVPPRSADALATAVVELSEDDERRARLVERGRQRATEFSWDDSAARMRDLLEAIAR